MAAESIEWHEQCLSNQISNHHRLVEEMNRVVEHERRAREDIVLYQTQIVNAKHKKKRSFDRDKFMKGKKR